MNSTFVWQVEWELIESMQGQIPELCCPDDRTREQARQDFSYVFILFGCNSCVKFDSSHGMKSSNIKKISIWNN